MKYLELEKIFDQINLKEKSVLEVGCGQGDFSEFLVDKCSKLTGIDSEEISILTAKEKIKGADFLVADGCNLPFHNESYEAVVFSKSLHHLDSVLALKEAHRVLVKGGYIIIIELVPDTEYQRVLRPVHNELKVLNQAVEAVFNSGLNIVNKVTIDSPKSFESFDDLISFLVERFEVSDKIKLEEELKSVLSQKIKDKPLILDAKLDVYLIKK